MPLTLVKEDGTGLANANSYANLADAIAYHAGSIAGPAWTSAGGSDDAKTVALVQATRTMDSLCAWAGIRKVRTQALGWPRCGASFDGLTLDDDAVPVQIVAATCEFARLLLTIGDPTLDPDDDGTIASETIGPLKTDYRAPAGFGDKASQLDQALPRSVMALLRPLLADVGNTGGLRFVSTLRV